MLADAYAYGRVDAVDEAGEIGRDADDEGGEGAEIYAVRVAVDAVLRSINTTR